jgi:hypothetical protein
VKKKTKAKPKAKKKAYTHSPDHYNKSESYLVDNLDEELKDAWQRIREYGEALGEQKIYASGKAIMFSKKVCYFFVRPKRSFLEVVIFLNDSKKRPGFASVKPVSKTKSGHTFKLVHADQVEGELTRAIDLAFSL